jgi:hypothetical protein
LGVGLVAGAAGLGSRGCAGVGVFGCAEVGAAGCAMVGCSEARRGVCAVTARGLSTGLVVRLTITSFRGTDQSSAVAVSLVSVHVGRFASSVDSTTGSATRGITTAEVNVGRGWATVWVEGFDGRLGLVTNLGGARETGGLAAGEIMAWVSRPEGIVDPVAGKAVSEATVVFSSALGAHGEGGGAKRVNVGAEADCDSGGKGASGIGCTSAWACSGLGGISAGAVVAGASSELTQIS